MRKVVLGLMIVLGFGLSGCMVNAGNESITKKENVKKLRVYKTTQAQTKQILGVPSNVMMLDGGKEKWTYQHTGGETHILKSMVHLNGVLGGGNQLDSKITILTLTFNANGVLIRKKYGY